MSATALYKALLDAGTDEELAERAAEVLPPIGELAELCTELKAYFAWRLLGGMALMLSIAVAFIRLT